MGGVPMEDWPVTEDVHYTPLDIYSYTKFCQEETARSLARREKIRTIALRPPAFMPADELHTVFRMTGCFALVHDIAMPHVLAVRLLADTVKADGLDWFVPLYVTNDLPYTREDVALLGGKANPMPLARKYWPEAYEWMVERGYEGGWLPAIYDNSRARQLLGWQPEYTFERCYRDYRRSHPEA